jgi:hypothetical protein
MQNLSFESQDIIVFAALSTQLLRHTKPISILYLLLLREKQITIHFESACF